MEQDHPVEDGSIGPGVAVHDSDGHLLGYVTSFTPDGFEVETVGPDDAVGEDIPGREFGEGYLMWRCADCGEMGELATGLPDGCPSCGTPREGIVRVAED